jgi:hypothetical protein
MDYNLKIEAPNAFEMSVTLYQSTGCTTYNRNCSYMYELLQSDRRPCPMSSIQSREARIKREILKVSTRIEKAVTFTN